MQRSFRSFIKNTKIVPFFYKEREITQKTFRSFIKNGRNTRMLRSFERTSAQPWENPGSGKIREILAGTGSENAGKGAKAIHRQRCQLLWCHLVGFDKGVNINNSITVFRSVIGDVIQYFFSRRTTNAKLWNVENNIQARTHWLLFLYDVKIFLYCIQYIVTIPSYGL